MKALSFYLGAGCSPSGILHCQRKLANALSLFMDGTHSSGDFTHPHFQIRTLPYVLGIKQTRPNLVAHEFTRVKHCLHYSACMFPKAEWKSPAFTPGGQQWAKGAENLLGSSKKQHGKYPWDASLAEKMTEGTEIGVAGTLAFKIGVVAGKLMSKTKKKPLLEYVIPSAEQSLPPKCSHKHIRALEDFSSVVRDAFLGVKEKLHTNQTAITKQSFNYTPLLLLSQLSSVV